MKKVIRHAKDGRTIIIEILPPWSREDKGTHCRSRGCDGAVYLRGICQACYEMWRISIGTRCKPTGRQRQGLTMGQFREKNRPKKPFRKQGPTRCTVCGKKNHSEFRTCERCTRKAQRKDWYAGKRDEQSPPENW